MGASGIVVIGGMPASLPRRPSSSSATAGRPASSRQRGSSPVEPIRFRCETGDQDLFDPVTPRPGGRRDWALAAERMAEVLADNGCKHRFPFSRRAVHVDPATVARTRPEPSSGFGGPIRLHDAAPVKTPGGDRRDRPPGQSQPSAFSMSATDWFV